MVTKHFPNFVPREQSFLCLTKVEQRILKVNITALGHKRYVSCAVLIETARKPGKTKPIKHLTH